MMIAQEDILLLIQLVKKDHDILEKKNFLETAPGKITFIEDEITKMDEELRKDLDTIAKLESEKRTLDSRVESHNVDINKKKIDRETLKSNKQYKLMGKEIEYLLGLVDEAEERILTILDEILAENEKLARIQEKINNEKEVLLSKMKDMEREIQEERDSLLILEDEKVRILPHISDTVQRLYNRILKAKGDSGVANLVGDICQGCYSRMPPQKAHEIRRNDRIIRCEFCGRILVYYEAG